MSAIAGVVRFDGAPAPAGLVERMTAAMAPRGPDGVAHWTQGHVALGCALLRATAESREERQPLANARGDLHLVFDGVLSNWTELREKVQARGAALRDRSDAELVLAAYDVFGEDCVREIDGDFAFVVWDGRRRVAFCARDRLGRRPFFYMWTGRAFVFASGLRPVLDSGFAPQTVNEPALAEYLAAEWSSRDETLWRGVMRLVAAHTLAVDERGLRIARYWRPRCDAPLFAREEDYVEHYRAMFADCVRRAARTDRPLACEVSGGLDSSAVFASAEQQRRAGVLPAPALVPYTLAPDDRVGATETQYARAVAAHLGLDIREIAPTRPPLDWYRALAREAGDFPAFPNAAMFEDGRRQAAQSGARVLLTGEGGDEFLSGGHLYYADALARGRLAAFWRDWKADRATASLRMRLGWLAREGVFPLLPPALQTAARQTVRVARGARRTDCDWLAPSMRAHILERRAAARARPVERGLSPSQQEMMRTLDDAFAALVSEHVERLGARHGLETRSPMLSRTFVETAFATPERMRLKGDVAKYVHVRAMGDLLPPAVRDRRDKAEFSGAFRIRLDDMRDLLTREIPAARPGWLAPGGVRALYDALRDAPARGAPNWTLWSIFGCHATYACNNFDSSLLRNPAHGREGANIA